MRPFLFAYPRLVAAAAFMIFCCFGAEAASPSPKPQPQVNAPSNPTETTAAYGNWVLHCVTPPVQKSSKERLAKQCEVIQTIQIDGQKQPLAQLAIGRLPNDKALIMTAVLPVNVSFPGMIKVADEEGAEMINMSWMRCINGACFASAKVPQKTLQQLEQDTQGNLQFSDANDQVISIPLSWFGLEQGLSALSKQ